jgi:cytochrome b
MAADTVKVWDAAQRLFHWALVASFAVAWLTADDWRLPHTWAGYAAAALVAFRLAWGFVGTPYARFSQFVRGPLATLAYLRDVLRGREPHYLGHNPAGGAMIVVLLALMAALCLTGYLSITDAFWGEEWLEELHEGLANLLLAAVVLHVAGVIFSSLRHKENLVAAMFTGVKRLSRRDEATAP